MGIKQYTISPKVSVREAIKAIDDRGKKVILITDEKEHLLGIFTDGDMRKYILKNGDLMRHVGEVMNTQPIVFRSNEEAEIYKVKNRMVVYPIVDQQNRLIDAIFWNDSDRNIEANDILSHIPVVIMAGGKGTRLYPYTKILPKPLISIGDLTISEHIIGRFRRYGCEDFKFILNYKGNMIKAYFNELEKDYQVDYLEEKEYLGTGGGLYLLKNKINQTFFVSNCDIIIDTDYSCIYDFHKQNQNKITFICALRNLTVPYGVITLDEQGEPLKLTEKPSFSFLANAGLYLLEPEVLEDIKEGTFMHLTDLIGQYIKQGKRVGVYPISEKSWLDMGQLDELENMLGALGVKQ